MALKKKTKAVLFAASTPVLVWMAASLCFTIAGRDLPDCDIGDCLPTPQNLRPEENAYTAIREFGENRTLNSTAFCTNYSLRFAYLLGTTNRLDLADEARAFLAAESNTIATAERILAAKGIDVPFDEISAAYIHFGKLQRIPHVYEVTATYEAAHGDLAAGRKTLMDVYRIGRFLQTHDSLLLMLSDLLGHGCCRYALGTASNPLFAPEDDEAWRAKLRELNLALREVDAERAMTAAKRSFAGYFRMVVTDYATNEADKVRMNRSHSALATACPGYVGYSFQPNRTLAAERALLDEFCRKVGELAYDVEYATRPSCAVGNRLSRNWIGVHIMRQEGGFSGLYSLLFERRFQTLAFGAVLACRSYKAKHGVYPESLSVLVPEFLPAVPRDPYDGEELRYNAKGGYVWTRGKEQSFCGEVDIDGNGRPHFKDIDDWRCTQFLNPGR